MPSPLPKERRNQLTRRCSASSCLENPSMLDRPRLRLRPGGPVRSLRKLIPYVVHFPGADITAEFCGPGGVREIHDGRCAPGGV